MKVALATYSGQIRLTKDDRELYNSLKERGMGVKVVIGSILRLDGINLTILSSGRSGIIILNLRSSLIGLLRSMQGQL